MEKNNFRKFFEGKNILVTGGAGSIGSKIVEKLIKECNPNVVRVLDNNEASLFRMIQRFGFREKMRAFIGDVRDKERLIKAMEGADIVFHAAALKHVFLSEYNPFDVVKTNVIGTQNVIQAAIYSGVEKVVNVSTDKAANPANVMGATKLLTERLITSANEYYKGNKKTLLFSVRFGNVLNSNGSVIPIFKDQIKKGGPVTVTDKRMERFVMSIPKAINLVFKAVEKAEGGEVFILKMPMIKIYDLANTMIELLAPKYGFKPDNIKIKIIGRKIGEKIKEEFITDSEIINSKEEEEMFVIYPNDFEKEIIREENLNLEKTKETKILSKEEIKKIISGIYKDEK